MRRMLGSVYDSASNPIECESFKLSTDAFFVEKLRDVVGLYLNPPDNALVLSH